MNIDHHIVQIHWIQIGVNIKLIHVLLMLLPKPNEKVPFTNFPVQMKVPVEPLQWESAFL